MCSQCKRHTQSIQADNSDVSRDKKKKKGKRNRYAGAADGTKVTWKRNIYFTKYFFLRIHYSLYQAWCQKCLLRYLISFYYLPPVIDDWQLRLHASTGLPIWSFFSFYLLFLMFIGRYLSLFGILYLSSLISHCESFLVFYLVSSFLFFTLFHIICFLFFLYFTILFFLPRFFLPRN